MKLPLFWKLTVPFALIVLAVVTALDLYATRILREDLREVAFARLESLAQLGLAQAPAPLEAEPVRRWSAWLAAGGTRVTVIDASGRVLSESERDARMLENHGNRPEIVAALGEGRGRAIRFSSTVNRNLLYLALRHQPPGQPPVVLRLSVPVAEVDAALGGIRGSLWSSAAALVLLAAGVFFLFARGMASRLDRMKRFCRRVGEGDFRTLPVDRNADELAELSATLAESAGRVDESIRQLKQERNQSAAILSSMAEGVGVIDADRRVIFCNNAFCRTLQVEPEAARGRPLLEVVRESELLEAVFRALAERVTVRTEIVVGSTRIRSFDATAAPVQSDEGSSGAVVVLHDVTELRRLERARRDLVANVSHELRTPLTAIQGFAETLLSGAMDDEQNRRRFIEIIRDHSVRLGALASDLLKLAQVEAGELPMEMEAVPIGELIGPCLETTRLKAEGKQIEVQCDCPDDLPTIRGNRIGLQEVLQNLLDNAVRYTPDGGHVRVLVNAVDGQVVLTVSDSGIGIPRVEHERIFERFYRVDTGRARQTGGTGLGLAIAKHIVEAHKGRIEVESEVDRGATFRVYLPLFV